MSDVQLKGNLKLNRGGATPLEDVSEFVAVFHVTVNRDVVLVPGTLAAHQLLKAAGERVTLNIGLYDDVDVSDTSGMFGILWRAARTPDAEVQFSGSFNDGPAGTPSNPIVTGWALVNEVDIGGKVGDLRYQTLALPVRDLVTEDGS